ncbi:MFS transporter [Pseudonocardia cypriaca]|uniref:MFS transporter n=1 Tax=Pseudonocardia cypriaca TaxID=882449 RepID=A0A543GCJ3_9PSEU|nr:MFS transporter [Pseudonocardia cypriaca]TQM43790.1 MFS transporter [Pseudonocardia cypriaca]
MTNAANPAPSPRVLVAVLTLAGITVSLQQTSVILLLPQLPRLLDASPADTSWAITATLLAGAVSIPTFGRLADMWGKRRMLLVCLGMLVAGSVTAALSTSLAWLVVGRAMQGMGAAVVSLGISLMRDQLHPQRLVTATALMSTSLGVGGSLGLPLSALLAQYANWRVLFWAAAGLGALSVVLVLLTVPESKQRTGGRFDLVGALLLAGMLVCLLLAISEGGARGWGSPVVVGLYVAAAVLVVTFGRWELRTPQPLIDLHVSRRAQVLLTNTTSIVFGYAMLTSSLVLSQLLQLPTTTGYGFGEPIVVAGLLQAPGGLCMMAMSPVSARLTAAQGPRTTLMVGALVIASGYGFSALFHSQIWHLLLSAGVVGSGIGLGYAAMPSLIMGAVPVTQTASANSLNNLCRCLGTSIASAMAGLLLATMTTTVGNETVPSRTAFVTVLLIGAAAALLALLLAAFIPRRCTAPPAGPAPALRQSGLGSSPL